LIKAEDSNTTGPKRTGENGNRAAVLGCTGPTVAVHIDNPLPKQAAGSNRLRF